MTATYRRNRIQILGLVAILLLLFPVARYSQDDEDKTPEPIGDISGTYHFLSADDTLGILEEEGKLKGYIEIIQGEEESDAVLSYDIVSGKRKRDRLEFKTNIIHRKFYRFSGKVTRGSGHSPNESDYLQLYGMLEIVTVREDKTEASVERKFLVFKSIGTSERETN